MYTALDLKGFREGSPFIFQITRSMAPTTNEKSKKRQSLENKKTPPPPKKVKPSASSPKTSSSEKKQKSTKSRLQPATKEQIKELDDILGFSVFYNMPTGLMVGHCAFDNLDNPFFFFPVILTAPLKKGALPVPSEKHPQPYMPGAMAIGHIRLALIQAYIKTHPGCDPTSSPWEKWELWRWNSAYYGTEWNKAPESMSDLDKNIRTARSFGGATATGRLGDKIISVVTQKKYSMAVWLEDWAKNNPFQNQPENARIASREELLLLNQEYMDQDSDQPQRINRKKAKKAVEEASENEDSSSDEAENSDAEDANDDSQ